jgi:hypothetical protein
MDFATIKDSAILVLMFIVFGAPALAIAARIAIKPIVEVIARVRDLSASANAVEAGSSRVEALEAEITRLSIEVERLKEAEAFTRQLGRGNVSS